jgi:hypothetical protein
MTNVSGSGTKYLERWAELFPRGVIDSDRELSPFARESHSTKGAFSGKPAIVPWHTIGDDTLRRVMLSCFRADEVEVDVLDTDSSDQFDKYLATLAPRLRLSRSWIALKWSLVGISCLLYAAFNWSYSHGIEADRLKYIFP